MGVPAQKAGLKKELKLRQLFSLAFGTIIGVGWVTVLGKWLTQAGSLGAVIAFLAGGLVMIFIGLTYSEMAAMFPVSGGEVAYAYEAYGLKTSFMTGWLLSLTYIGVVVFEVISVGWVAGSLFPALEGRVPSSLRWTCPRPEPLRQPSVLLCGGGSFCSRGCWNPREWEGPQAAIAISPSS